MSAAQSAECQARLQVSLHDIINFFEEAGVESHSVDNLNEFISKNRTFGFLELSESFGECMAFINHDDLVAKLQISYQFLADGYNIERKIINKRLKFLKEDKKSDPAVIDKNENNLLDVEQKKATVLIQVLRLRAMSTIPVEHFKNDEKFNSLAYYNKIQEHRRSLIFGTGSSSSK
jgi:hypothetical protein